MKTQSKYHKQKKKKITKINNKKKQKYPKTKKLKEKNMIIVNLFNQPMD